MRKRYLVLSASLAFLGSATFGAVPASAESDSAACTTLTGLQAKLEAQVSNINGISSKEREVRENTDDPEEKIASREDQLSQTIDIQNATADQLRGTADTVENPQVQGVLNNWADSLNGFSDALQDRIDSGLDEDPDPKAASWLHAAAQRVNLAADAFRATLKSVCAAPPNS
jgi:septal ring factor EnvC (AmiA/AmiB activator)